MDLANLSNNWKILQQSLGNGERSKKVAGSTAVKRKYSRSDFNRNYIERTEKKIKSQKEKNELSGRGSKINKRSTTTNAEKEMGVFNSRPDLEPILAYRDASNSTVDDRSYSQPFLENFKASTILSKIDADNINSGLLANVKVGKYIAIDCEMVGVGPDPSLRSMLARVSVVNYVGEQVYDSFVMPKEPITDYRSAVSGITADLLRQARSFETVQQDICALLEGRVLVGHAIRHDLDALKLGHPKRDIRDTSCHRAYRDIAGGRTPSLKRLARDCLGTEIQGGAHSSIEDARATMSLFKRDKEAFEQERIKRYGVEKRRIQPVPIDGEVIAARNSTNSSRGTASSDKDKKKKKKKKKKNKQK